MRVIAGKAKKHHLACPPGRQTRPTTDRIKETLFNMIQAEVSDAAFLDLFSGSGGIGIEALSRGSRTCVFVEKEKEAAACIKANLKSTKLTDCSRVMVMDAMQALKKLKDLGSPFDIIFMDPPYRTGYEKEAIVFLLQSPLVKEGTLIIVESALETELCYLDGLPCRLERIKKYKTNQHLFLRVGKDGEAI